MMDDPGGCIQCFWLSYFVLKLHRQEMAVEKFSWRSFYFVKLLAELSGSSEQMEFMSSTVNKLMEFSSIC